MGFEVLRELAIWLLRLGSHFGWLERRFALRGRLQGPWNLRGVLWMHGASLGECQVLLELARRLPSENICITTQKNEVCDWLASRLPSNTRISIAPLDHPEVLVRLFTGGLPKALILCENELWPGWIRAAVKLRVPVALVSGRISARGLKLWNTWGCKELTSVMQALDPVWVQSAQDAQRFISAGVRSVRPGGDWKWLLTSAHFQDVSSPQAWETRSVDLALLSVHREDWNCLAEGVQKLIEFGGACVLVPRYPHEQTWFQKRLGALQVPVVIWPHVQRGAVSLVAQLGVVHQVLAQSRLAVMGGSFCSVTTHNFREPLMHGVPVLVGPYAGHTDSELTELVAENVARRIQRLDDICIGRKGQDCWLSGWFPWEERQRIPQVLAVHKSRTEEAFSEFRQWLGVITKQ